MNSQKKIYLGFTLIGLSLGIISSVLLFNKGCNESQNSVVKPIYDSIPFYYKIDVPNKVNEKINYTEKDSFILRLIDSTVINYVTIDSILRDYCSERSYLDSILQDSSTKVKIWSVVQYNELQDMRVEIQNFRPVSFIPKKSLKILAGGTCSIGLDASVFFDAGFEYGNNAGLIGTNGKQIQITYLRKFNFKK